MSDELSPYAKRFSAKTSAKWTSDNVHRSLLFRAVENFANDRFQAEGYLFLNDLYAELGLPKTRVGQYIGWVRGDDYIQIRVVEKPVNEIWVDFNVPGHEILDALGD